MRILGIDPGFALLGYGLIELQNNGDPLYLDHGVIETGSKRAFIDRLAVIDQKLGEYIQKQRPQVMAVEGLYSGKNVKTVIDVAQARGVVMIAGARAGLEVTEYTPLQVKQAISSYGRADKGQMQKMVQLMLKIDTLPQPDDAADALAVALCEVNYRRMNKIGQEQP